MFFFRDILSLSPCIQAVYFYFETVALAGHDLQIDVHLPPLLLWLKACAPTPGPPFYSWNTFSVFINLNFCFKNWISGLARDRLVGKLFAGYAWGTKFCPWHPSKKLIMCPKPN